MKRNKNRQRLLATTVVAFATVTSASAIMVYSETFPDTGAIASLNSVDWNAKGAGAANFHNTTSTDTNTDPVVGRNNNNSNSYLFQTSAADSGANLWWATDFTSTAYASLTTITFDLGNNSGTEDIKVAIQSGSTWFVSTTNYNFAGSFSSFANRSLDFTTAAWNDLDFDALTVGATGDPTAGAVTQVGFFSSSVSDNVRIDNVVVNAIPEPSGALIAVGLLGLALVRRRR